MNSPRRIASAHPASNARSVGVHPLFVVVPAPALAAPANPSPDVPVVRGTSVRRRPLGPAGWLFALVGVLALLPSSTGRAAEPARAPVVAPIESPAAAPDSVIYPKNSPEKPKLSATKSDDFPLTGTITVVLLLAAGGYLVFKRGTFLTKPAGPDGRRLAIEETRPLGNKQFLAVATYGDRKLLIAVCPGKIDLLCRLDESGDAAKPTGPTAN